MGIKTAILRFSQLMLDVTAEEQYRACASSRCFHERATLISVVQNGKMQS